MSAKEEALNAVKVQAAAYDHWKQQAQDARADLLEIIVKAYDQDATQLEIANQTKYSRQRVAQWLKEANDD